MKILTITLNPAFDVHCHTAHFEPFAENLAAVTAREAGGKGVNISRALTVCGEENTALVVLGEDNATEFRDALRADGIVFSEITVPRRIRENITLHTDDSPETRISFAGFTASPSLLGGVEKKVDALVGAGDLLTFTGRVPDGIPMPDVKAFLIRQRERGVHVTIDSRSFSLADLKELRPFLIKPNQEEISSYLARPVSSFGEVRAAAEDLHRTGIENVMISLGGQGALLACEEGTFLVRAPEISPLSTIGAGDSSVAGFLAAFRAGENKKNCLCRAVAYGSAACLTSGTKPPKKEDVDALLSKLG